MSALLPVAGTHVAAPDTKVEQLVLAEQVRALYEGTIAAGMMLPPLATAFTALFWRVVDHRTLLTWYVVVGAVLPVANYFLHRYYIRNNHLPHDAQRWLNLQQWRFFLLAGGVGSMGVVLFVPQSLTHTLMMFACLFALTSLLAPRVAQHRSLWLANFPVLLLPFIVRAAIEPETTTRILAALSVIGFVYSVITTRRLSKLMRESLVHRFNNEMLVEQLQVQKRVAETALVEAEEANRAKSRFLAAASHDLRQPMHAIGLFVSAMKPHVVGEEGSRILERVVSSVRSTETMFNAMLDVSRLDAGVLVPEVKPIALAPLLNRLATEYAPRAEAKGLRLRARVGTYHVSTDPTLLERVIRNYLGNAIRYTSRGAILLACRRRATAVSIEVWDTGEGIPEHKYADIYKEFYQLANPERDRSKGLGLGLAIVKRISVLLNHPTHLKSAVGRGSKFSIEAPLAISNGGQTFDDGTVDGIDDSALIGTRVLVIDDEADARDAIALLLKQWGCLAMTADCGRRAAEIARNEHTPFDVILSDYRLREGETGIAAIQAIQREFGPIPAALVTGDTAAERLKEAIASGYELLHKPLNPLRLKQALYNMLTSSEREFADDALPQAKLRDVKQAR
jgi:two-component system, sensor histidine kinase